MGLMPPYFIYILMANTITTQTQGLYITNLYHLWVPKAFRVEFHKAIPLEHYAHFETCIQPRGLENGIITYEGTSHPSDIKTCPLV